MINKFVLSLTSHQELSVSKRSKFGNKIMLMNALIGGNGSSRKQNGVLARALVATGLLFRAISGLAQPQPPDSYFSTNTPLDSWSFQNTTNWTSDLGYAPVSFTNLNSSWLGDGASRPDRTTHRQVAGPFSCRPTAPGGHGGTQPQWVGLRAEDSRMR